jgi:hypothetical protein
MAMSGNKHSNSKSVVLSLLSAYFNFLPFPLTKEHLFLLARQLTDPESLNEGSKSRGAGA